MFALVTTVLAAPPEEAETRARFFMPALEVGPVWSSDPALGIGVLFRTSVDYRFERLRAPFLRASYDATTVSYTTNRLKASAGFHDLLLGGGVRYGPDAFQLVGTLQGGVQYRQLPRLDVASDRVEVKSQASLVPIVTAGLGAEWYVFRGVAATAEFSARLPLSNPPSIAGAFTIGVTTSL